YPLSYGAAAKIIITQIVVEPNRKKPPNDIGGELKPQNLSKRLLILRKRDLRRNVDNSRRSEALALVQRDGRCVRGAGRDERLAQAGQVENRGEQPGCNPLTESVGMHHHAVDIESIAVVDPLV